MLKKGDIIIAAVSILVAVGSFAAVSLYKSAGNNLQRIAVIKQNDQIIRRINLETFEGSEEINVSGDYDEVILVENGRIRFKKADCPDKVCVKTGWLEQNGDIAVCLPNRVMIKIEGEPADVDIVTY
jgi:hypothetical protein